jgi:hypothetical protein
MNHQIESLAVLIASTRDGDALVTKQDRDTAAAIVAAGWTKQDAPRGGW